MRVISKPDQVVRPYRLPTARLGPIKGLLAAPGSHRYGPAMTRLHLAVRPISLSVRGFSAGHLLGLMAYRIHQGT